MVGQKWKRNLSIPRNLDLPLEVCDVISHDLIRSVVELPKRIDDVNVSEFRLLSCID